MRPASTHDDMLSPVPLGRTSVQAHCLPRFPSQRAGGIRDAFFSPICRTLPSQPVSSTPVTLPTPLLSWYPLSLPKPGPPRHRQQPASSSSRVRFAPFSPLSMPHPNGLSRRAMRSWHPLRKSLPELPFAVGESLDPPGGGGL